MYAKGVEMKTKVREKKIKHTQLDGKPAIKFQCPNCNVWAYLDDDQYNGRVSVDCSNCDYHETHNFKNL